MTIAAVLKHKGRGVVACHPTDTVAEITDILSMRHIGAVVVLDGSELVLGIVSERDIIHALAANGAPALGLRATQLMTRTVTTVTPQTTIERAMAIMTTGRFRHLPVIERGALVGIVSIGDVVKAHIAERESEVDSLRAYVAGVG